MNNASLLLPVSSSSIQAVRRFFARQPDGGFVFPFVTEACGGEPIETLKALCWLVGQGELEVDVGHHTWTWQFRRSRRTR